MYWKLGELDATYHLVPETEDLVEQSARFATRVTLFPTLKKTGKSCVKFFWGKKDSLGHSNMQLIVSNGDQIVAIRSLVWIHFT